MPINLLGIIDFYHESFNRLTINILSTMSIVPMDVHQVGEGLLLYRGITHIVPDM